MLHIWPGSGPCGARRASPARRRDALAAAILCACTEAAAGDAPLAEIVVRDRPPAPLRLDEPGEAGTRLPLAPLEIPASVEIVDGETLRRRGDHASRDAVTRATGISGAATPGNGGTALASRGFAGHGSVMQLYDGTRLYVGAGTLTFPVDTWTLERIEVLRGPASVLFGEGAIGGAINYIPRRAERVAGSEWLAALASFDTYRLAGTMTGPLGESLAYRVSLSGVQSQGHVDRGDFARLAFAGSLSWEVSPSLRLALSLDRARADDPRYWGTPLIGGAIDERTRRRNYNVIDSRVRYSDQWLRLRAEWDFAPGLTLRNETYRLSTDRHWRNLENYTFQPASGLIRRTGYLEILHDQTQTGNRLELRSEGRLAGLRHRSLLGFDANRIEFLHTNNAPFAGVSEVSPFAFEPGAFLNLAGTTPRFRTRTQQAALFAESALDLAPGLILVGGLRTERIDFQRVDLQPAPLASAREFRASTGRAGAVYTVAPGVALYAQYATGVDPLGSLITTTAAQTAFDLTRARQIEVGAKFAFLGGRGEATVAIYDIAKRDLLVRDPAALARSVQIGRQSSRGVEIAIGLRATPRLLVEANIAALSARFDDFIEPAGAGFAVRDGNRPPNVPLLVANAWLTWRPGDRWELGAGMRYVGDRYANNANSVRVPAYLLFDAYAAYRLDRGTSLTLRARNLTDRVWAVAPYHAGTQLILGDPRALELAWSARF
jgi:iron complex outermembrane receptor protein